MIYLPHSKDILLYLIMPSPPPLLLFLFLHSKALIIYLSGIELGQSVQFPLMKHPSHFEIFGSITSPSISVFSALLFKV